MPTSTIHQLGCIKTKIQCIQGISKRHFPGCVSLGWSNCVFLPAVGKQNTTFLIQFHTTWEVPFSAALYFLEDLPLGVLPLPPDLLGLVEGRVLFGLLLLAAAAAAVLSLEGILEGDRNHRLWVPGEGQTRPRIEGVLGDWGCLD